MSSTRIDLFRRMDDRKSLLLLSALIDEMVPRNCEMVIKNPRPKLFTKPGTEDLDELDGRNLKKNCK
ncbi:hypothetical protein L2E82_26014 [Cichorium intybus]|uniref:Uncharacterized protein n=1 Tax=Cichorium intybus TaxID=13427 RepID=A0ACB9E4V4_CICIN|nr:hypothetical protein L2E82_26014 [Cichorium intybus]